MRTPRCRVGMKLPPQKLTLHQGREEGGGEKREGDRNKDKRKRNINMKSQLGEQKQRILITIEYG